MLYIEEPEAHLFQAAQGIVTEYVASIASAGDTKAHFLITTHSPYLLAKVNNLLKAGELGRRRRPGIAEAVAKILPRETWLRSRSTSAYAIVDGNIKSILDNDGLIDASYVDDVSNDIAREFSELIDIEVNYVKA
jgi:hypothetical protein